MTTEQSDTRKLAAFRTWLKKIQADLPDVHVNRKEATRLLHMNDRQLWRTVNTHVFLLWAETQSGWRDSIIRDRMRPVAHGKDGAEEDEE